MVAHSKSESATLSQGVHVKDDAVPGAADAGAVRSPTATTPAMTVVAVL
jgi:hypothetical protein